MSRAGYRRIKLFSWLFPVLLVGYSQLVFPLAKRNIFPFFAWDLYASAPHSLTDYDLRIETAQGQSCWLEDYLRENPYLARPIYQRVQRLGTRWSSAPGIAEGSVFGWRRDHVLDPKLSVALYRRTFDPVPYAMTKTVTRTSLIATFAPESPSR